jgi:hexosaminidase
MNLWLKQLIFLIICFFSLHTFSMGKTSSVNLIPKPVFITEKEGKFLLNPQTVIIAKDSDSKQNAILFNDYLLNFCGYKLNLLEKDNGQSNSILLTPSIELGGRMPPESYRLSVSAERIKISGIDAAGLFYGIQSLIQLLGAEKKSQIEIPCLEITDYPKFKWRGMHLDVSRHFFPKEFIKKYLDFLAMYKMNIFHWHLTDDQGWRIEIKKYPKLTDVGAWRNGTLIGHYRDFPHKYDSAKYGGYYTQEDIKEIIEYANQRHITIVPEIEMPGHSLAAITSYSEFSCTGGPFEVANEWGIFEDVFCPKEETFKFLEDVLTEVCALFPGKYIHIGGDESPKDRWKKCPKCQERIKKEGLKDETELQSYFTMRIEKIVNSKGKTVIGWDEILEGGLAPNATVMSWRGTEGGIDAARQKHNVVMTPGGYCYFDYYQGNPKFEPIAIGGYTTVEKVYSYNPVPSELTKDEQKYILGAQGNVWTEYISTPEHVEYMVFPRICALSEILWNPADKNYPDFKKRLIEHFKLLDMLGINYSKSIYEIQMKAEPAETGISVSLIPPSSEGELKFSLAQDDFSMLYPYTVPLNIISSSTLSAAYYENEKQIGNKISLVFYINKATGKNVTLTTPPHENYNTGGAFTLVDGIKGIIPWYGKEWLGWNGKNMEAVVDLGRVQEITKVSVDVLDAEESWIYLPIKIEVYISSDGTSFEKLGETDKEQIRNMKRDVIFTFEKKQARFVKVFAENYGKIPTGKPGEGYDAWLFVDEISIE